MKILLYVSWPVRFWSIPDAGVEALRRRFPDIEFVHARTLEEAVAGVHDVDAVLAARITPEMMAAATRLRWVHSSAVNVHGLLPLPELAARGIAISNSRGIQDGPIAETVLGGLLMLRRKMVHTLLAQREHRWSQNALMDDMPVVLHGQRMAILGLGGIGLEVAARAHAFGMTVVGVRRRVDLPLPASVAAVYGPEQLDRALDGADVLVVAATSGRATERIVGARELARLNPGAIVVNVARASIVDQEALLTALRSGALGGAVLDVFEEEPLDPAHPFWDTPNVLITPHSAGFNARQWEHVIALYIDNIERFRAGAPLLHAVDSTTGY
jgi:phosphoglycerate dehydrogenase-like enzyme